MREHDHYDCIIRLKKGERIDSDSFPVPSPVSLQAWAREVRGGILTGAFDVELHLNLAIESYFLGPAAARTPKSEAFSDLVLSAFNFERRCSAGVAICKEVLPTRAAELQAGLTELRTTRNAMAHNPCWISASNVENGIVKSLKVSLRRGKQTIDLTNETVELWNDQIRRLRNLTRFLAEVVMDPQTADPDVPDPFPQRAA